MCRSHAGNSLNNRFSRWLVAACCLLAFSCGTRDPKFQQYYVQGEQLYLKNCSNCHQADGKGLGLVYPPLNPSDYMDRNFEEVICQMKQGKEGEITVNGNVYHQPMPGNPLLTDLEIAEIATYIFNTWGHERGFISVQQVTGILKVCEE